MRGTAFLCHRVVLLWIKGWDNLQGPCTLQFIIYSALGRMEFILCGIVYGWRLRPAREVRQATCRRTSTAWVQSYKESKMLTPWVQRAERAP